MGCPAIAYTVEDRQEEEKARGRLSPSLALAGKAKASGRSRVVPGPLADDWRIYSWSFRPSPAEAFKLFRDLLDTLGWKGAGVVLGVSSQTVSGWAAGRPIQSTALRGLWLCWVMVCAPDRVETLFDVVTWGRFRPSKPIGKRRKRRSGL